MSDLQNPIFDDEKEFLERQKQEYKNALLSDVEGLKDQTTQMGKGVLLLGGAVAGVWVISKLISGGTRKRKKKKKKAALKLLQSQSQNPRSGFYLKDAPAQTYRQPDDEVNFGSPLDFSQPVTDEGDSSLYNTPAKYFDPNMQNMPSHYALHQHYHAPNGNKEHADSFLQSDFVKSLATQAMAFLLIYLSKKAEEFVLKNVDIATEKGYKTQDVDYTDLNADAGRNI
ncbi:hypothetical protein I5M27_10860 [Adhaeribacter sp. BT258]|uniref:Uncharacterized protein n=1 Tax=Adhaeribacter terrigena TaxID=2793070 RepID=A0ABS1C279_9BACT|nr:hypothetical protein [Adhaeribacter terrigena]MBK0403487.1 hypothetical protein [Adhaeribacter terrigena]